MNSCYGKEVDVNKWLNTLPVFVLLLRISLRNSRADQKDAEAVETQILRPALEGAQSGGSAVHPVRPNDVANQRLAKIQQERATISDYRAMLAGPHLDALKERRAARESLGLRYLVTVLGSSGTALYFPSLFGVLGLILAVVIGAILYFGLVRPQQNEDKELDERVTRLEKGQWSLNQRDSALAQEKARLEGKSIK